MKYKVSGYCRPRGAIGLIDERFEVVVDADHPQEARHAAIDMVGEMGKEHVLPTMWENVTGDDE
jgi:hypothetical protein